MKSSRKNAGLTLLEVMVASAVLTAAVSMVYLVLHRASDSYANETVHLALDERARDVLAQMAREIREAGLATFVTGTPPAGLVAGTPVSDIQFGRHSGFDLGARKVRFENVVHYRWAIDPAELPDGKDNNGNGLVDEGILEKTETFPGRPVVRSRVCGDVTNQGLTFVLRGRSVAITLELARKDLRGTLVRRTAETSVELRN